MARITRKSAWIAVGVIGVASAAAFLAQRVVAPRMPAQPAARVAAASPAPSAPQEEKGGADTSTAQPGTIPFSPRVYPATPVTAATPAAPSAPAGAPQAPAHAAASNPASPASPGFFSQPSAGNAVLIDLSGLRAAADAGDREAACRVGVALMRCASAPSQVTATTRGPVVAHAECAGTTPQDRQAATRYLSQAAAAGNAAARRAMGGDASVTPADCSR